MKKVALILLAAIVVFGAASTAAAEDEPFVIISTRVLSEYISSNGFVIHDEPVVQTSATVFLPWGFFFNVWGSIDFLDGYSGGDEVDSTLGWGRKIWLLDLGLGVSYFDVPDLFDAETDIIQPYFEVDFPIGVSDNHTLTPFARLELLFPLEGRPEVGEFVYGGIRHAWTIQDIAVVCHEAVLLYYDSPNSRECGLVGQYNLEINWSVYKFIKWKPLRHVTLDAPVVKARIPIWLENEEDNRRADVVFGAGMTITLPRWWK